MAAAAAEPDWRPLTAQTAAAEAQFLTRYALDALDGTEHPALRGFLRGALTQLDASLRASGVPEREI